MFNILSIKELSELIKREKKISFSHFFHSLSDVFDERGKRVDKRAFLSFVRLFKEYYLEKENIKKISFDSLMDMTLFFYELDAIYSSIKKDCTKEENGLIINTFNSFLKKFFEEFFISRRDTGYVENYVKTIASFAEIKAEGEFTKLLKEISLSYLREERINEITAVAYKKAFNSDNIGFLEMQLQKLEKERFPYTYSLLKNYISLYLDKKGMKIRRSESFRRKLLNERKGKLLNKK